MCTCGTGLLFWTMATCCYSVYINHLLPFYQIGVVKQVDNRAGMVRPDLNSLANCHGSLLRIIRHHAMLFGHPLNAYALLRDLPKTVEQVSPMDSLISGQGLATGIQHSPACSWYTDNGAQNGKRTLIRRNGTQCHL